MTAVVFLVVFIAVLGVVGAVIHDAERKREGRR